MHNLLFIVLGQVGAVSLHAQSCCAVPDTETTVAIAPGNLDSQYEYVEYFQQTIADAAADSFDGLTVTETVGAAGNDTCYNNDPNSTFLPLVSVDGSSRVVASSYIGATNFHNQWGADAIGYFASAVNYYRAYMAAHSIGACGATVYQNMVINCPSEGVTIGYSNNVLTETIYTEKVVDCRQENYQAAVCATIGR